MPQKIILASTSPYRKKLLEQLNISFTAVAPLVDEETLKKTSSVSLSDLPLFLAQKKAESLIALYPHSIIIGSDQMGLLDSHSLNKAGTRDKAITQLLSLQGRTHTLLTALSVYSSGQWFHHVDTTKLTMRPLTREQIVRYVDLENPIDCAGSYKIEALGVSLFENIESRDPSAIVGLPLMALTRILDSVRAPVL
jgi:septum formation protein